MDKLTRLKTELHKLVYGRSNSKKGKTLFDIADNVGRTSSYISQIADVNRENPFPIDIALETMRLKKQYNVIQYMASELDGVFIKLPKFRLTKKQQQERTSDYQKIASEAVSAYVKATLDVDGDYSDCDRKLSKVIEASVGARLHVKKIASKQIEMF